MLSLFAVVIALAVTCAAGPYVKTVLEEHSSWETGIQENIQGSLDAYLETQMETTEEQQDQLLDELPLPGVLTGLLKENNNSSVYEKLGVDNLSEYVSSYLGRYGADCHCLCHYIYMRIYPAADFVPLPPSR